MNTPTFCSAGSTNAEFNHAFCADFDETALALSRESDDVVALENINLSLPEDISVSEGDIDSGDKMVKHANKSYSQSTPSVNAQRVGALTFNPSSPSNGSEEIEYTATDDQAELMRWHYRLGHLTFQNLMQLAVNGEIPK